MFFIKFKYWRFECGNEKNKKKKKKQKTQFENL